MCFTPDCVIRIFQVRGEEFLSRSTEIYKIKEFLFSKETFEFNYYKKIAMIIKFNIVVDFISVSEYFDI